MLTETDELLLKLYAAEEMETQHNRYIGLLKKFEAAFPGEQYSLFSSPGRIEIGGNHTDHNHGKVIAAAVDLDIICAASESDNKKVVLYSEGYAKPFIVDIRNLEPVESERGSTGSLIRGIAAGFKLRGYKTGGLNACISSNVLTGSGLSSSASIEVLIGTIFNYFYNDGIISSEEIAIIGRYAENIYFGKPCGLMDQLACATGGIVSIDFYNAEKPEVSRIDLDFARTGYKLIVVDTGISHDDLTEDYASIPMEMKQAAAFFNKEVLAEVSMEEVLKSIKELRGRAGDRAVLRVLHFLEETKRVDKQVQALKNSDFQEFLNLVNESGNSSFKYLQNIFSPHNVHEQSVSLALALSEIFIRENKAGACRVHGGGFAGTILVMLPEALIVKYIEHISNIFEEGAVKILSIRNYGAVCLNNIQ